jgi:M6 family metalloprotease-like protein
MAPETEKKARSRAAVLRVRHVVRNRGANYHASNYCGDWWRRDISCMILATVTIKTRLSLPIAIVLLSLSGCGGGGGSGGDSGPPPAPPAVTYTIGGTATGVVGMGLSLRLNGGTALAVVANGTFTFPQAVVGGAVYTVTIETQPSAPTQVCTLAAATGTVAAANVTSVTINCPAPPPVNDPTLACRLTNPSVFSLALGFPRHSARLKSSGTVRIKVLFVDFPNAEATDTVQQTLARISPASEAYFAAVSFGRMAVVYEPHLQWLRMSRASNTYGFAFITYQRHHDYMQEAVNLAGSGLDWSTTDALVVLATSNAVALINGPAFVATPGFGVMAGGREILNGATSGNDLDVWGAFWANHELGHALGLPDLYLAAQPIHRAVGMWSIMGNIAGPARELTGFERWILGWVDDAQVACATSPGETVVTLSPIERQGGTKMVVIPLSTTTAVVAEVRRVEGYDEGFTPGVLAYFVDSTLTNTQGAMRVLPFNDSDSTKGDVALGVGASLSYGGVTVHVLQSAADGDTLLITR